MPGYAIASRPVMPALFSVQEKHLRDPLGPSAMEQLADAVALGQPRSKKPRVASRPQMRRRILLDVMETQEVFEVKADMPGVEKHNIKIDIDKGVLTLSVAPSPRSALVKNGSATEQCCAARRACRPCGDATAGTAAPLAQQDATMKAPDTEENHAQQGKCPCGDKCACNPCRCSASNADVAGCGASRSKGECHNGTAELPPDSSAQPAAGNVATNPAETEAEAGSKGLPSKGAAAATWHVAERTRRFQRRAIRIPDTADLKNVSASYIDGVLTVSLPKLPAPSAKVQHRLKCGERMVDLCLDGAVQFACMEMELHARSAVGCACLQVKGEGNYVEVELD